MPDPKKVVLTARAINDLDRLDRFLRPSSPTAADRLTTALQRAIDAIGAAPGLGRPSPHANPGEDTRERIVRLGRATYILRYRAEGEALVLVCIHNGREDRGGGLEG